MWKPCIYNKRINLERILNLNKYNYIKDLDNFNQMLKNMFEPILVKNPKIIPFN